MKLIDADELLEEAKRISGPVTGDGWDNFGVYALIERQKTVDAVPVVHGYWIMTEFVSEDTGIWWSWHCSNCGDTYDGLGKLDERKHKYCHHCGAKMDGGEKDATVD